MTQTRTLEGVCEGCVGRNLHDVTQALDSDNPTIRKAGEVAAELLALTGCLGGKPQEAPYTTETGRNATTLLCANPNMSTAVFIAGQTIFAFKEQE